MILCVRWLVIGALVITFLMAPRASMAFWGSGSCCSASSDVKIDREKIDREIEQIRQWRENLPPKEREAIDNLDRVGEEHHGGYTEPK